MTDEDKVDAVTDALAGFKPGDLVRVKHGSRFTTVRVVGPHPLYPGTYQLLYQDIGIGSAPWWPNELELVLD